MWKLSWKPPAGLGVTQGPSQACGGYADNAIMLMIVHGACAVPVCVLLGSCTSSHVARISLATVHCKAFAHLFVLALLPSPTQACDQTVQFACSSAHAFG